MHLGPYRLDNPTLLAPMAGVTDRPFRQLCRRLGAGLAVSEMVASNPALRHTRKSRLKRNHDGEDEPRVVQIAGADPAAMADAARFNVDHGAQIIDINMGCPAKKVCNRMAGSALLADEPLVARILEAVVAAVAVPVTLKIRTGPCPANRNAPRIAALAEACGIAALTVHGRTRADAYRGRAEYDTLRAIRDRISIPLIANGDIDAPERARDVLAYTGADAVMIGRAAQGRPWLFREITHFLGTGRRLAAPAPEAVRGWMLGHLEALYGFYGEHQGVRIARKHIGWYLRDRPGGETARRELVGIECARAQYEGVARYFDRVDCAA